MSQVSKEVETNKVRFVYVKNADARIVTVAYQYADKDGGVRLATAECSTTDRFQKRIGREIAINRLITKGGKAVSFTEIGGESYGLIAKYVTDNINTLSDNKPYMGKPKNPNR